MHLRRALLLLAIVLGLTALAASLAPAPKRGGQAPTAPPSPTSPRLSTPVRTATLSFQAPAHGKRLPVRKARAGAHVMIEVATSVPGQASIDPLGLTATAEPATAATFDVLLPAPGQYAVIFTPSLGSPEQVGTVLASG